MTDLSEMTDSIIAKLYQQAADGDGDAAVKLTDYGPLAVESLSRLTTNQLRTVRHSGLLFIKFLASKGIDCSQAIPAAINGLRDLDAAIRRDALECLDEFVSNERPVLESNLAQLEPVLPEIELLMNDRFDLVRSAAANTFNRIKAATKKP